MERFYKVLLGMINEKKKMKSYSVFHKEQKTEFQKCNCFLVDFWRYSFGRIKVISAVVEREYTTDITRQICFPYQLTDFYMIRGFTKRYFLIDYSYILENHFYFVKAPNYCLKPSLSRIFCVNSYVKVHEGPYSLYPSISHIITLHVHYLQKERNRFRR